jgi:hypothetical protein
MSFFEDVPNGLRTPLARIFSKAVSQNVASLAKAYLERENPEELQPPLELPDPSHLSPTSETRASPLSVNGFADFI